MAKNVQILDMSRAPQYKHCPEKVKNERESLRIHNENQNHEYIYTFFLAIVVSTEMWQFPSHKFSSVGRVSKFNGKA